MKNEMVFEFDEDKINAVGEYTVEKIHRVIDLMFETEGVTKISKGVYGSDDNDTFKFMLVIGRYCTEDWVKDYCIRWDFTCPDEGTSSILDSIREDTCGMPMPIYTDMR